jgi:hypothetical protein
LRLSRQLLQAVMASVTDGDRRPGAFRREEGAERRFGARYGCAS